MQRWHDDHAGRSWTGGRDAAITPQGRDLRVRTGGTLARPAVQRGAVRRLMRFHLAPLTCGTRLRRRIEAALARHLSRQPGLVGSFEDVGIRYSPRHVGEEPIDVLCYSSAALLGLPACLKA
jgi:hypothetical protein